MRQKANAKNQNAILPDMRLLLNIKKIKQIKQNIEELSDLVPIKKSF
jgi:hypothetical protein